MRRSKNVFLKDLSVALKLAVETKTHFNQQQRKISEDNMRTTFFALIVVSVIFLARGNEVSDKGNKHNCSLILMACERTEQKIKIWNVVHLAL